MKITLMTCVVLTVRCRAYSGLESGKVENKLEEHELGDDDDVIDDKNKYVRNCSACLVYCLVALLDYLTCVSSLCSPWPA